MSLVKIEIDQSGKVEQTSLDTVIALANNVRYVVVLPKKTKRALQTIFRRQGRQRMFVYVTFAALAAIIIKQAKPKTKISIDIEYQGHEDFIKQQILEYLRKLRVKSVPALDFNLVGKSSPAHNLAAQAANKKVKIDKVITLETVISVIWGENKKDRVSTD